MHSEAKWIESVIETAGHQDRSYSPPAVLPGGAQNCSPPRPNWRIGFLHPINALLCAVGAICFVGGVIAIEGLPGLLPYIGSGLFFAGTANVVLNAHGMRSLGNLISGGRARRDSIVRECHAQRTAMTLLAEQICQEPAHIRKAVALAVSSATRSWNRGIDRSFAFFLFCQVIAMARFQQVLEGDSPESALLDPDKLARSIIVLNRAANVPSAHIAKMLNVDIEMVQNVIETSFRPRSVPPSPLGHVQ